MGVSAKLHVYFNYCGWFDPCNLSHRSVIRDILTDISRVSDLSITSSSLEVIYRYSKVEPLPQFSCVSSLCVTNFEWLPTFLESFPNLKSLTLVWDCYCWKIWSEESDKISFSSVPECLLSSLEFVDIETRIWEDATETKLARYFLDNSVILKKLTLRLHPHQTKDDIFKEILRIPRRSTTCQVLLL
ncbi:unnamed protein product [Thlaspi arvense]|uniref:FBD domain-containing protein n=1 Tax=Thlaspi arvense TaxID=13288 RepID=A0AAU9ST88_THLAR|nr:unnamed protein product [Thlaspi arvense]